MSVDAALRQDEPARLARLSALSVLDSGPEAIFDQVTQLAAELCGVPIALVSLVDEHRQWFKSNVGLPGVCQTHRDLSFCAHAILGDALFEVPDAARDMRFARNPLVTGAPDIRFYAGAPIVMPHGERVGSLCVIDRVPRCLTALQRSALTGLGQIVATALLEREQRLDLTRELAASEAHYRLIVEGQTDLVSLATPEGRLTYVNAAYAAFFGSRPQDMVGRSLLDFVAPHDQAAVSAHLQRVCRDGLVADGVNRMVSGDAQECWVAWTNRYFPAQGGRAAAIQSVGRDITEQKRAELAQAASEARYRLLYESTPAMLHSIDLQGRLLNVSDTWLATMGYPREEVVGRASVEFLTPASRRHASEVVLPEFFTTGQCKDVGYQMVRKDGSVLDVLLSAVLERDACGQPLRSLAVVQDVTERNATAASLHETTHLLQLVLDGLPARISYWDVASRNQFANKSFLSWFGVSQADIKGRHVRDVLGKAWFSRIEAAVEEGLSGRAHRIEVVSGGGDALAQYTDLHFAPDLRDGEVCGLFVFALDITAHRRAERELVVRERRFKLLVDGVRDYAIYMLDVHGRVETWNAGAQRNKGYRAEQVIGRHFGMFFAPEAVASGAPERLLAQARDEGRVETEGWRVRGDGSRYWSSVLLSSIHDEQGRLIGYAVITGDLTERRQQEATREQHQAQTERALAEKETLLKEVYHRVKNNLQVVHSLLNLQRRTLPQGAARGAIEDSAQRVRAMALVHEMLYQSGNLAAVMLPSYTRDLVDQIADSHGIDRRRVVLSVDVPQMQTGLDSAMPFGLLLTELLTNCFKHAFPARRTGTVRVSLLRRADGDLLTVADDGIGLAQAFDPDAPTTSMGLKLADGLARQLGGVLAARNDGGAVMSSLLTRL